MNFEALRSTLRGVKALNNCALRNFVIRGDSLENSRITKFTVKADTADVIVTDVLAYLNEVALNKEFLEYDPSYQTSSAQVLVEGLSSIPALERVDDIIRQGDVDHDSDNGAFLAMAHSVGSGDNKVIAYRMRGQGIATRRRRGLTLIPHDGVYSNVSGDVLFYEPKFDAISCRGTVILSSAHLVQTKLQAPEKAQKLARATLQTALSNVEVMGKTELEDAVAGDPTMRAKMAAIARILEADPTYVQHLTTENLVGFAETHPEYALAVVEVDGRKRLQFDNSAQHRYKIPKLLADDFLHSNLTSQNYEAGSKHRV